MALSSADGSFDLMSSKNESEPHPISAVEPRMTLHGIDQAWDCYSSAAAAGDSGSIS